jgi:hypothetical protein
MLPKNLTSEQRLNIWRTFRQQEFQDISEIVANFPFQEFESRYLDYYTPKSWPSPFEIVSEGYLCQSGVTLVLTATLMNKKFLKCEELSLPVISNNITGSTGLVLLYEDQVFNFTPGKVETLEYLKENSTSFQYHRIAKKDIFLDI